MLEFLTQKLQQTVDLDSGQVTEAINLLIDENVAPEAKADFLSALARKGETVEELAAFARELRDRALVPPLSAALRAQPILDVCGTGGDHQNAFNISTTVAVIVSAAGVPVAKHGNRAITSQAGSADVLEALSIPIALSPAAAAAALEEKHFAFFFAPQYHPAFKHIAPARKLCAARGQRTLFNFLGPLLNPARPAAQLVGVPDPALCEPMAHVLQRLGVRHGMVVCGRVGNDAPGGLSSGEGPGVSRPYLDELSPFGMNTAVQFGPTTALTRYEIDPAQFPNAPGQSLADLRGGNREANAMIIRQVLGGTERGAKRDAVLLNAAAALVVAGVVTTLAAGRELAGELIDSGRGTRKLHELAGAQGQPPAGT